MIHAKNHRPILDIFLVFAGTVLCNLSGCSSRMDTQDALHDQDAQSGGSAGNPGAVGTGGSGSGGSAVQGLDGGYGASGSTRDTGTAGQDGATAIDAGNALDRFSFFVTSLSALRELSKSEKGFGGDLRFGKADGLSGADEICRQIAEKSMPGSGKKGWRAFLSVTKGPNATPVNAIDRVGEGPWYDRLGRLFANTKADLAKTRPAGANAAIVNDFPNEEGVLNHDPDGAGQVDNHDMLTGSNATGQLYSTLWSSTCHDWTSAVGSDGKPRVGHSWPRGTGGRGGSSSGESWISALDEAGCAPGINLIETGGPNPSNPTVGSGGGYGGFYCFALTP